LHIIAKRGEAQVVEYVLEWAEFRDVPGAPAD
jgi:hypothetical protein